MDILSNILRAFRVNASYVQRGHCQGRWVIKTPVTGRAVFHMVTKGQCWMHIDRQETSIPLATGDIVLMPRDMPHSLSYGPNLPNEAADDAETAATSDIELVCAYFQFSAGMRNMLLDALPDYVVLKSEHDRSHALTGVLQLLIEEASADIPGTEAVLERLSDAVFVYMIRHYLATSSHRTGLLAALQDRYLGEALRLIHESPEERWTVETLASKVGLSRSAFAKRFLGIMSETPMNYLTRWRMHIAHSLLREKNATLLDVAARCGYQSESAFAKTFKRSFGIGPGAVRRGPLSLAAPRSV